MEEYYVRSISSKSIPQPVQPGTGKSVFTMYLATLIPEDRLLKFPQDRMPAEREKGPAPPAGGGEVIPVKVLLKMVPKRVSIAFGAVWLAHLVIAGFVGAVLQALVL